MSSYSSSDQDDGGVGLLSWRDGNGEIQSDICSTNRAVTEIRRGDSLSGSSSDSSSGTNETFYSALSTHSTVFSNPALSTHSIVPNLALSTHSTIPNAPSPQNDLSHQSDRRSSIDQLVPPISESRSNQPASHQLNPDDAPAAAARTLNSLHDDQYIRRFAHPIRELAEGDLQSASTKLDQGSFDLISGSPEAKLDTCVEAAPVSSKPLNNESFVLPATPSPEFNAGNDLSESLQQSASIQLDTDACSKRPSFSANSIPPQPVSHPTTFSQPDADAVLLVSSSSTASSSSAVSGNATAPATTSRVDVHTVYATYFQRLKQLKQIVYGQAWDQLIVLVTSIADVKIFHEGIRRQWGESVTGIHQFHRQETQNQRMRQFNRGFQRILITTSQFFLSHSSMLRSPPHLVFLRPPHTLQDFHATITRVGRAGKPSIITFYYDPFNWREDQLMR